MLLYDILLLNKWGFNIFRFFRVFYVIASNRGTSRDGSRSGRPGSERR